MATLATYLPPWRAKGGQRAAGIDEDALTLAVGAGLLALEGESQRPSRVVFVTRQPPLLEGGNGAALLGGLGLPPTTEVIEQLGGGPAALDAASTAPPGTLVVAADVDSSAGSGGGAWFAAPSDTALRAAGRSNRSLPLRARSIDGVRHEDDDPRLQRERGLWASVQTLELSSKPLAVAGVTQRDAKGLCLGDPPSLPTSGASSPFFALAASAERGDDGVVMAVEQAQVSTAYFAPTSVVVRRWAPAAQEPPVLKGPAAAAEGAEIKMVFTAYERAFNSKLGWEAGQCRTCETLAFPPRHRCLVCGSEEEAPLVPLPRTGSVYTTTTIHVPVPGLLSPYTLVVVELDKVHTRALATVTGAPPGTTAIGQRGTMVLRRVAIRSGIPDYGYAFMPDFEGVQ